MCWKLENEILKEANNLEKWPKWSFCDPKMSFLSVIFGLFQNFIFQLAAPWLYFVLIISHIFLQERGDILVKVSFAANQWLKWILRTRCRPFPARRWKSKKGTYVSFSSSPSPKMKKMSIESSRWNSNIERMTVRRSMLRAALFTKTGVLMSEQLCLGTVVNLRVGAIKFGLSNGGIPSKCSSPGHHFCRKASINPAGNANRSNLTS